MPVGKRGRLTVAGRCVLVFDGTVTQTVNVYDGPDEVSAKEIIIRLRQPLFTSEAELEAHGFETVEELQAYLVEHHAGEVVQPPERLYRKLAESLAGISADLKTGRASPRPTVREFLASVGAQRRGPGVVSAIRECLAGAGLLTNPDFEAAFIDSRISFVAADSKPTSDVVNGDTQALTGADRFVERTYRISKFPSANRPPERVAPDDPLRSAVTKMQLSGTPFIPVMRSDWDVKGVVSLRGLALRRDQARPDRPVREVMDRDVEIVDASASLFRVLARLREHEYVLVRGADRRIVGIVTATDMVRQFQEMTEPFLLLSEIEHQIRGLIEPCFAAAELQAACGGDDGRCLDSVDGMTFGDYVYLLQDPENWDRLGIEQDGSAVLEHMRRVNLIRNRVMHFDPDGIAPDDLSALRAFSGFLRHVDTSRD